MAKSLSPMAVWGLVRELRIAAEETRPLLVSGPLAEQLGKELSRGAAPGSVLVGGRVEDAGCLIRILTGAPTEEDERELKAAKRARVPVVVQPASSMASMMASALGSIRTCSSRP